MLRPRCTKIALKRATSDAITRSQPSARLSPAPAATPFTLAIVGLPMSRNAAALRPTPRMWSSRPPVPRGMSGVDEVGARAEALARAGDHEHAVVAVGGDLVEHVAQAAPHRAGDRVELVGPVERERHHAVASLDEEVRTSTATVAVWASTRSVPRPSAAATS